VAGNLTSFSDSSTSYRATFCLDKNMMVFSAARNA
jgi:hypothetical protein